MSKRQPTVAISTSEAEYQALAQSAREVQWLKELRCDLGPPCSTVTIQGDNQGSISWATDWQLICYDTVYTTSYRAVGTAWSRPRLTRCRPGPGKGPPGLALGAQSDNWV